MIGVKFTEARYVAGKTVDLVFKKLGKRPRKSTTASTPLPGGQIEDFQGFLQDQTKKQTNELTEDLIRHLVYGYGSAYPEVLYYLPQSTDRCQPVVDHAALTKCEILYGIHKEMAQKLSDVVFRRTEIGGFGHPGNEALGFTADIMKAELGWSSARRNREIQEVNELLTFMS